MKLPSILVSAAVFTTVLAGCAGQPAAPASGATVVAAPVRPAAAESQATLAAQAAASTDTTLTADKIRELKREGYTMTVRDGKTWFCTEEVKLGSHVSRPQTVCLTAEQIAMNRAATQQNFGDATRAVSGRSGD